MLKSVNWNTVSLIDMMGNDMETLSSLLAICEGNPLATVKISLTKDQWCQLCYSLCSQITKNNSVANDLTCHEAHVDGLVQDCSISIANTLGILQSCIKPPTNVMSLLWYSWNIDCINSSNPSVARGHRRGTSRLRHRWHRLPLVLHICINEPGQHWFR